MKNAMNCIPLNGRLHFHNWKNASKTMNPKQWQIEMRYVVCALTRVKQSEEIFFSGFSFVKLVESIRFDSKLVNQLISSLRSIRTLIFDAKMTRLVRLANEIIENILTHHFRITEKKKQQEKDEKTRPEIL